MIGSNFSSLGTPPLRPSEPFSAFDENIVKTVEKAICAAWDQLKNSARLDLTTASETAITAELQDSLIDVLNSGSVAGFVSEIFTQPVRDASVKDYTGLFLEKKPDLTFFISSAKPLSSNKGLFFECKPIGNITNYLGIDGLERFCDGRYAWAMPHAGMIGYVQRKTPPISAQEAMEARVKNKSLTVRSQFRDTGAIYHPVWVSTHDRPFVLSNGKSPGPILIRHIWLET